MVVCFALDGSFLILALVESYVVISAGVLFMGFGGSRFTKDYALKDPDLCHERRCKAIHNPIDCLASRSKSSISSLNRNFTDQRHRYLRRSRFGLVMLALTKIIPDMIQALLNGVSAGGAGMAAF